MTARLAGRTILVTRAAEDADPWARRLEALGAAAVILPCLTAEVCDDPGTAAALREAVAGCRWLAVTSRRGVECAARLLGAGPAAAVGIAAVGPATAEAATALWGRCDLIPADPTSAGLGRALAARIGADPRAGRSGVVLAAVMDGRRELETILAAAGIPVTRIEVYRTVPAPRAGPRTDLAALGVTDILLASPSAVTGLLHRAEIPAAVRVITIGPTTTAAAREAGLGVTAEAPRPDFDGMLEAMS